jgi:hypothetical protein
MHKRGCSTASLRDYGAPASNNCHFLHHNLLLPHSSSSTNPGNVTTTTRNVPSVAPLSPALATETNTLERTCVQTANQHQRRHSFKFWNYACVTSVPSFESPQLTSSALQATTTGTSQQPSSSSDPTMTQPFLFPEEYSCTTCLK